MAKTLEQDVAYALRETLISPNEIDTNLEAANVVDGLFAIARAITGLSTAVTHAADVLGADMLARVMEIGHNKEDA